MHLVRLVVAGQHIHDEVDAEPHRHLALRLATGNHSEDRSALSIDRPGAAQSLAPTMTLETPSLTRSSTGSTQSVPDVPATRKFVQQVKRFRQHMIGRDRHQRRDLDPADQPTQTLRRKRGAAERAGRLVVAVARIEEDRPAGFEITIDPLDRLSRKAALASETTGQ